MITFIVGGGACDEKLIKTIISTVPSSDRAIIACDKGLLTCLDLEFRPDYVIGDFDSSPEKTYERAVELGLNVKKLIPEKDDSDAEAALNLAFEKTEGDIIMLGATGSRLDHVMGNMALIGMGLKHNRRVMLVDKTNRIQMIGPKSTLTLKRDEQFGKYVSIFPYMGTVEGVNLEGFKYPLKNASLEGFNTLTVSNEIVEPVATISIENGYLMVFETMD